MTAGRREALFQLCGGVAGLAVAIGGIYAAKALAGPPGRFALLVSVPFGIFVGFAVVKLLHFAQKTLVDDH